MSETIGKLGVAVLAILGLVFVFPILNTLVGAFVGLIVGLFFEGAIFTFLASFGVDTMNLAMWQVGAALGFIGSFFRTIVKTTKA